MAAHPYPAKDAALPGFAPHKRILKHKPAGNKSGARHVNPIRLRRHGRNELFTIDDRHFTVCRATDRSAKIFMHGRSQF